ncbi:LysR family transcriptional regulator [Glutamicibacter sp. MCAF14]|uniref:LysR family transcriptional regulator n=1 Tax=Glutamicibacter sp. MCAF14 TaxID=3233043 RepID=UPI003F92D449
MLDFKRLTLLRELHLRGSIAGTARMLGVSPSAVSQQLAKLEAEAGLPLLEQVGRSIRLTPAAQQLIASVDEAVSLLESASAELETRRSRIQGVIRFAAFSTFARTYLPRTLRSMAAIHPDVVVEFTQLEPSEALDAVTSRRADIAIVDDFTHVPRRTDSGLVRNLVTTDQLGIYLPHPVSSLAALAELNWAFEPRGTDAHAFSRNYCRALGFEPRVLFDSPDPRLHCELVAAGVAAAFLPRMVFGELDPPPGSITEFDPPPGLDLPPMFREIHAVGRRSSNLRPAAKSFLQVLRDVAG